MVVLVTGKPIKAVVEIVDATGLIERVVAKPAAFGTLEARWSPDRSMLAWVGDDGLMVEPADGSNRRLLVPEALTFAWSPDGQQILVGRQPAPARNRIITVLVKTGRRVEVASGPAWVTYAALNWLPDGKSIAYLRRNQGHKPGDCCGLSLVVAAADGSHPRRLWSAADGGIHDTPGTAWSPDGRFVSLGTEARDPHDPLLAVINVATGQLRVIHRQGNVCGGQWAPDSRRLADGNSPVVTRAPDGQVIRVLGGQACPLAWSRDGDLFLIGGRSAKDVLVSRGGTERPRLLFRLPKNQSIVSFDPT